MKFYDDETKRILEQQDRERLATLKAEQQQKRDEENHKRAMEKIQLQHELNQKAEMEAEQRKTRTEMDIIGLKHQLEPEIRDLNYKDLIKSKNIELQALETELAMRDKIAQNDHDRAIDRFYQQIMMEITKESARTLDEKNKAIAIIRAEQEEKRRSEILKHEQETEKSYQNHAQTLREKAQEHEQNVERDKVQGKIHRKNVTHEEITRLAVRVLARELGLEESEIDKEKIEEWIADYEKDF